MQTIKGTPATHRQQQSKPHPTNPTRATQQQPTVGRQVPLQQQSDHDLGPVAYAMLIPFSAIAVGLGVTLLLVNIPRETGMVGTVIFAIVLTVAVYIWAGKGRAQ